MQISINISLKFVSKGPINNVQMMAWRWSGDKSLSKQWWSVVNLYAITRSNDCLLQVRPSGLQEQIVVNF